jgi:nucleoside-diphosphate-sugar epimerase
MQIAILGATGQVGKSLTDEFLKDSTFSGKLVLFARNLVKLDAFLNEIHADRSRIIVKDLVDFESLNYDVIINCIGFGTPESIQNGMKDVVELTNSYDDRIIQYLTQVNSKTVYIYLSSGIVYNAHLSRGAEKTDLISLNLNDVSQENAYRVSKIYTELKHRLYSQFQILDIRIFGFCSRYLDFESSFFLAEVIRALKNKNVFKTNDLDIVRDYMSDSDFYALIRRCIQNPINSAVDAVSAQPVRKMELLKYLQSEFGLEISVESISIQNPTGLKMNYFANIPKDSILENGSQDSSLMAIRKVIKGVL